MADAHAGVDVRESQVDPRTLFNIYRGDTPPLWLLTVSRMKKPSWCEDCPMPANGPKVRAAEARITVLSSIA